jgi:YfiH family protein
VKSSFLLGDDGIYRCSAFQKFIWQSHGFGTRKTNPEARVTLRQIHSDRVLNAHGLQDREEEGDALITDEPGLSIGVRTADCVSVLLLDSERRTVAVVHAGWKGTLAQIVRSAIQELSRQFGTVPANLHAAIGPCIRERCYEVGPEVAERFPDYARTASTAGVKTRVDLVKANVRQMKEAGVKDEQVFDSCLCTACSPEIFFSYRREPENPGRMLSAICRLA